METRAKDKESQIYLKAQEDIVAMCLFDDTHFPRISEVISPDNFLNEKFNTIVTSVYNVFRKSQSISVLAVAQDLENRGSLKYAGGVSELYRLHNLGSTVSLSVNPVILANIVKESFVKTEIRNLLTENKGDFVDDSGTTAKAGIEVLQNSLSEYSLQLTDDSTSITGKQFMGEYEDLLKERKSISEKNKEISGGLQGIPTMLPSLNKYTSGFTDGQLITVGAETGVGKSVFAIMSAIAALKAGKTVMFFTLEMSHTELFDRMIANMSEVKLNNLKTGYLSEEELSRIKVSMNTLKSDKFIIEADPNITVDGIRSKAINQQQSATGLDMIILDYLQLVSTPGRYGSRQEAVADMSRNMKLMAKTLEIPVMVLVQLNRAQNNGKKDDEKQETPTLDRIRESGAIAQDSDIVILLHRDSKIDNRDSQTLVLLEKNRNGESKKVIPCHTELAYSDFREVKRKSEIDGENSEENKENTEKTLEEFYSEELELPDDDGFFDEDEW